MVREYVGYDRLEGAEELALLSKVYAHLAPPLNFFMPTRRLESKTRVGSREVKVYDEPRTPFQRLVESAEVPQETKDALSARIALCSPVELQDNVSKAVMRLRRRLARASRKQTGARTVQPRVNHLPKLAGTHRLVTVIQAFPLERTDEP